MRTQRAIRRKRNLVAKNNRHKGGRHKTATDYRRKNKYPSDFVGASQRGRMISGRSVVGCFLLEACGFFTTKMDGKAGVEPANPDLQSGAQPFGLLPFTVQFQQSQGSLNESPKVSLYQPISRPQFEPSSKSCSLFCSLFPISSII